MLHCICVSDEEFHTIVAALRSYQECGYGRQTDRPGRIHEIASDGGRVITRLEEQRLQDKHERIV